MSFQSIRRSANPLSLSRNPGIDDCRNLFEVFRVSCRQHGMMHENNARDHRVANLYSPASPFARCHQTCGHPRSRNVERKNALVDCVQESFERRSKLQPFLARLHDLQPATVPRSFCPPDLPPALFGNTRRTSESSIFEEHIRQATASSQFAKYERLGMLQCMDSGFASHSRKIVQEFIQGLPALDIVQ